MKLPIVSASEDPPPMSRQQLLAQAVDEWFNTQVLPLEPKLMGLLRRHWRYVDDLADLRQEIYMRVYEGALRDGIPNVAQAFVYTCARNLLVDRARRAQVVSFDVVADLEELPEQPTTGFTPEKLADVRHELGLLQEALANLSPRCKQVVMMRELEGLSQKEIASQLGISEGIRQNERAG